VEVCKASAPCIWCIGTVAAMGCLFFFYTIDPFFAQRNFILCFCTCGTLIYTEIYASLLGRCHVLITCIRVCYEP
jgi:hypothetical protein